jgi:hypothetical protein
MTSSRFHGIVAAGPIAFPVYSVNDARNRRI